MDAILLNNTAPLFVPIVALLITGAKTPRKVWWGVVIGFIGVALVLHPGPQLFQLTSFIGLASGVLAAIAIVQIWILSKTGTTTQMFFYYFLIGTVASGAFALFQWRMPPDWKIWLLLGGIGIFGTLYQVCAL